MDKSTSNDYYYALQELDILQTCTHSRLFSLPKDVLFYVHIRNKLAKYLPRVLKKAIKKILCITTPNLPELPRKKCILVCDLHIPFPDRDAASFRMHQILLCLLELGFHVTFWPDLPNAPKYYVQNLKNEGIEVIDPSISFEELLKKRAHVYDFILISRANVAPKYLPSIQFFAPFATRIYDTMDLHYLRVRRQSEIEDDLSGQKKADHWQTIELGIMQRCNQYLVVSETEKKELERHNVPSSKIHVVSLIQPVYKVRPFEERQNFLFIGNFGHTANLDGLKWYFDHIWSHVLKKLPHARTILLGNALPKEQFCVYPQIDIVGFAADPSSYFHNAKVFICPLRWGAGVKGKIAQALAFGLPVVTTSIGAEGMHLTDKEHALIADDPEDFAKKLVRLHTQKEIWDYLSEKGQIHVQTHFSKATALNVLKKLFFTYA